MSILQNLCTNVELYYVLGLTIILLLFYRWYKRPKHFPPGPRGVPVLGSIPFLGKYPERKFKEWSKSSYGPIMCVRFGTAEMVVLNDFESIHEAYVKQPDRFSGRPRLPYFDKYTDGHGLIMIDYDEKWKTQRKFGLMTLRGLGMGKQSLEDKIVEETSYFMDEIRKQSGNAFEPSVLLHNTISNVICNVCFGRRYNYDDPTFKSLMKGIVDTNEDATSNAMFTLFAFAPYLSKIPPFSHYDRVFMDVLKEMMSLLQVIIKEHEETFQLSSPPRDFIDAFLVEMKKGTDPSYTHKQLAQYVRDLFEAGTETTSNTLNWTFICLLHYPQAQEKLRKEIMDVLGSSGKVSWSKRCDMPYTCAFMEEMFRFRTLVPLGLQHETSENTHLGNYNIPKGTMIASNVWAVHNDEKIWEKPEVFNPERFLNERGEFERSKYVIPFSVGPRHCLGEQLARMEFFIILVSLVQQFEVLPDPDSKDLPDIEEGSNGFAFIPKPYKLVMKEL